MQAAKCEAFLFSLAHGLLLLVGCSLRLRFNKKRSSLFRETYVSRRSNFYCSDEHEKNLNAKPSYL